MSGYLPVSIAHEPDVAAFLSLMIVVAIVAAAVRFVHFPYTIALVLTGLALSLAPDVPRFQLTPGIILTVFLPVLLFYGAYNLDVDELRAAITPVVLLALPGVAATTGLVGAALHLTTGLTWAESLLFGAIVAATDPVAVLAIFGELGAPQRLTTIVAGESLFNDGTALVLFATMLSVATASTVDIGVTLERFVVEVAGALALGAAVAVLGGTVLRRIDDALLEMTITLIMAYGGYLLAQRLGTSGPLETVAAGLLFGTRGHQVMSPTTRLQAHATWEFIDFLANSLLFLLVGLAVQPIGHIMSTRLGMDLWWPLLVAIAAVTVARAVVVWLVNLLLSHRGNRLPRGWSTVLVWAGLRGAVSLAAALSLPAGLPQRDLLLSLTFGVVLFTLLVQGLTTRRLLERFGLDEETLSRHDVELLLGRLRTVEAARRELEMLRRSDVVDEHMADTLLEGYAAEQADLRQRLDALYHSDGTWERQQRRELQRHLLRVQHQAAREAYTRGEISAGTLREILGEIDRELAVMESDLDEPANPAKEGRPSKEG